MYIVNLVLMIVYSFKSIDQFGLGVTRLQTLLQDKQREEDSILQGENIINKSTVDVIF